MNHILDRLSAKLLASTAADQSSGAKASVSPKPRLKRIAGKAALTIISTAFTVSILLGVDFHLHHKHGINLWGYRGPAVGKKHPGEKRIAVLGGSTAWGYGLTAPQSFPGQLQQRFAQRVRAEGGPPINVLNLASNSEGAYSFQYTLRDYDYLDYDAVLIYSGYNDLRSENRFINRHRSPVFMWTGYLPLVSILTEDKIAAWRYRLAREDKPVFTPPDAKESAATRERLSKLPGQLSEPGQSNVTPQGTCPVEYRFYCQQIYQVTDAALSRGKRVLIVTEPYISERHIEQQRALEGMLTNRFAGQARLRYLNLGRLIDLRDGSLCWDGMHLTEEGNRRIAEALTQPVLELLGLQPSNVSAITSKCATL
jgi:lysophospholipase L1-like esterase